DAGCREGPGIKRPFEGAVIGGRPPMYSCGSAVPGCPVAPGGGETGVGCSAPLGAPACASAATVGSSAPDPATGPLGEYPARQHPRLAPPSGPGKSPLR